MLGSDYRELIVPRLDNHTKRYAILIGGAVLTLLIVMLALVSGRFLLLILSLSFETIQKRPLSSSSRAPMPTDSA